MIWNVNVYNAFVLVTIFFLIIGKTSNPITESNVACANARLKRKLMLKEKKIKCTEKSHKVLLDEDYQRKINCIPLSDITMMDFLNREIQINNDITGNYNVQPPQQKTNAMK